MRRRRQHGASGLMIAVVLVLLVLVLLAARVLSRLGDAADDKNNTVASLNRAKAALDAFVASGGASARLPCPANPALNTGLEDPTPATGTCNSPAGTLPWATIGLRQDDALDAWGRKLSYRVYSGNKGSLTQLAAGGFSGPSMVNCTDSNTAGGGVTKGPDPVGLCALDHTTSRFDFLSNNKGLQVTDFGTSHSPGTNASADPVAYVVISHGPTGLGGYSASGVVVLTESHLGPKGDELDNTSANGPFHAEAWSDPDTSASSNSHFDDLVVYRTIAGLAQKASLQPRSWGIASLTFDAPTIALGGGTATSDTGTSTLTYTSTLGTTTTTTTLQGFQGTNATDISYDTTNGNSGIGVYGSGGATLMSYFDGDSMYIKLGATARQFAITLNDFVSYFGGALPEQVQLTFYKTSGNRTTQVFQVQKSACSMTASTLSTVSVNAGVDFDIVDVRPEPITVGGFIVADTTFSISAISACSAGVSCTTAIASTGTTCP